MTKYMLEGPCNMNELLDRKVFSAYFLGHKETNIMLCALYGTKGEQTQTTKNFAALYSHEHNVFSLTIPSYV